MRDFAIRFPFGEQPAPLHDGETLDATTTKSLLQQEGTSHEMADSGPTLSGSQQHATNHHHSHAATATEHATILDTNKPRWSFELERHKFKVKQELLRKARPERESNGLQLKNDIEQSIGEPGSEEKLLEETAHFARSATHLTLTTLEHTEMGNLLAPVLAKLQSLKTTTPESLPAYNRYFRVKKHLQVLKIRLLPIGKHILHILVQIREEKRGQLELKLCRHIAEKYWPLPLETTTHLRIQEMYRNDIYKTDSKTQAEPPNAIPAKTSEDKPSSMEVPEGSIKSLLGPFTQLNSDDQQNTHALLEIDGMD